MGLLADLVGLIANARADEPVRVALIGVGGSGKSELLGLLATEPGVEVVDDAHDLDEDELLRLKERVEDRSGRAIVVAHRPSLTQRALLDLDSAIADGGRLLTMRPLDVAEARSRVRSRLGKDLTVSDAERAVQLSAGRPALFDLVTSGAGAHEIFSRVAALGSDAVSVSRVLAVEPSLAPTLHAAVARVSIETLSVVGHQLEQEGLLDGDVLVPVIAEAALELLDEMNLRILHASVAEQLIAVGAAAVDVATHLRRAKVVGHEASDWFIRAAESALPDDAAAAEEWMADAGRSGVAPPDLAALATRIDAWLGRPTEVVSRPATTAVARRASVSAYAMLGQWRQARPISEALDESSPVTRWAAAMAGRPSTTADTTDAIEQFVGALSRALEGAPTAVDTIARWAPLAASASVDVPLPDEPIAVAALVACSHNRFGLGRCLLETSRHSTDREQIVAAWIALRSGSWRLADETRSELDDQLLHPRDQLIVDALDVALARRTGEIDELTDALNRALGTLERVQVDLLATEPIGEIVAAAARLDRWDDVGSAADGLEQCVRASGAVHGWRLTQAWYWLEAAVASTDRSRISARASELQGLADGDAGWAAVGGAASLWRDLSQDRIDEARVTEVTDGLMALDWRWEASTIAGAAAIRTSDPMVARRLLERARTLKPVAPGAVSGDVAVDSPLTDRETEIAALVAGGATYKEIGAQLFISPKTVEHHVARIRQKLGATSRAELLTALRGLV